MAQYKTIPSELLGSEIDQKCYLDYERGVDQPDDMEIEADWQRMRQALKQALHTATPGVRAWAR
jgi:hypothetical protein